MDASPKTIEKFVAQKYNILVVKRFVVVPPLLIKLAGSNYDRVYFFEAGEFENCIVLHCIAKCKEKFCSGNRASSNEIGKYRVCDCDLDNGDFFVFSKDIFPKDILAAFPAAETESPFISAMQRKVHFRNTHPSEIYKRHGIRVGDGMDSWNLTGV